MYLLRISLSRLRFVLVTYLFVRSLQQSRVLLELLATTSFEWNLMRLALRKLLATMLFYLLNGGITTTSKTILERTYEND